jgi:hypothetical protein
MTYLVIYWIWIDCTISITIKILINVISQKTFGQAFHSNEHKFVEKNILLKNYFHLKDNKNYVGGLCMKFHFICFIKMLDEIKEKVPPKRYKMYPKKSNLKQPPCLMLSP